MRKKLILLLVFILLTFLVFFKAPEIEQKALQQLYPTPHAELVEQYAAAHELDPLLVYAFIRTESSFDPNARSKVDARGLMQITEITFDWIKPRVDADEAVVFEDLYDPETAIQFGTYYLHRCLERYEGDVSTAAAAYHSGWGTVDKLLADPAYSDDGKTLDVFPYTQMNHYVAKINRAYGKYLEIYRPEGE